MHLLARSIRLHSRHPKLTKRPVSFNRSNDLNIGMADQVTINMATVTAGGAQPLDSADGRKMRNGERESRDVRHRTNGNHHHSTESDTDDHHNKRHHQHNHKSRRRSRSRSQTRSRTPSPSHSPSRRGRRNVNVGVCHVTLNLFCIVLNEISFK